MWPPSLYSKLRRILFALSMNALGIDLKATSFAVAPPSKPLYSRFGAPAL
jgi:hypothetical protein